MIFFNFTFVERLHQKLVNPNSLLFNDTTRIRLNQTRPSMHETFKLNLATPSPGGRNCKKIIQSAKGRRSVTHSNSFRSTTTVTLAAPAAAHRPKEPPPPPPVPKTVITLNRAVIPKTASKQRPKSGSSTGSKGSSLLSKAKSQTSSLYSSATKSYSTGSLRGSTSKLFDHSVANGNGSLKLPKKCQISLPIGVTTTSNQAVKHMSSSSTVSAQAIKESQKSCGQKQVVTTTNCSQTNKSTDECVSFQKVNNTRTQGSHKEDQNIEIVTRENSVSEIRIYSTGESSQNREDRPNKAVVTTKPVIYESSKTLITSTTETGHKEREIIHYAAIDLIGTEKPIIAKESNTTNNAPLTYCEPIDLVPREIQKSNSEQVEDIDQEPIYDDVESYRATRKELFVKNKSPGRKLPALPSLSSPQLSQPLKSISFEHDVIPEEEEVDILYSDISSNAQLNRSYSEDSRSSRLVEEPVIYDDTLSVQSEKNESSLKSRPKGVEEYAPRIEEESDVEEPLYDDVLSLRAGGNSSVRSEGPSSIAPELPPREIGNDSGTESEDGPPPPLPTSAPPPLPKVSTELPLLPFPLLQNFKSASKPISAGKNEDLKKCFPTKIMESRSQSRNVVSKKEGNSSPSSSSTIPDNANNVLDRTRSLLNELNEKLSKLATASSTNNVTEYSTYVSKVMVSSSSESSGVEEDYHSDKNNSLSNGSDDASHASASSEESYNLSVVSKLVNDTISMARGKFLDSMKLTGRNISEQGDGDSDEPIYEEIHELSSNNNSSSNCGGQSVGENGSSSPIYSDAFDAKSIFDGASRNEILAFLESIRDRLSGVDSVSYIFIFECLLFFSSIHYYMHGVI